MLRSEEQWPLKWLTIKQTGSQNLFTKERNTWIINMSWGVPWIKASNSNFHYRSPRERNDKLLQYSCLKNFMDRGIWQAKVHGIAKESYTTEWLTLTSIKLLRHLPFIVINRYLNNCDSTVLFKMSIFVIHGKWILCNYFYLWWKIKISTKKCVREYHYQNSFNGNVSKEFKDH